MTTHMYIARFETATPALPPWKEPPLPLKSRVVGYESNSATCPLPGLSLPAEDLASFNMEMEQFLYGRTDEHAGVYAAEADAANVDAITNLYANFDDFDASVKQDAEAAQTGSNVDTDTGFNHHVHVAGAVAQPVPSALALVAPKKLVVPVVPTSSPAPRYSASQYTYYAKVLDPRVLSTIASLYTAKLDAFVDGLSACDTTPAAACKDGAGGIGTGGQKEAKKETKKRREVSAATCARRSTIATKRKRANGQFIKEDKKPAFVPV